MANMVCDIVKNECSSVEEFKKLFDSNINEESEENGKEHYIVCNAQMEQISQYFLWHTIGANITVRQNTVFG